MFDERKDVSTEHLRQLRAGGMKYQEIADEVGMSKNGVFRRINGDGAFREKLGGAFCRVCGGKTEVIDSRDTEYHGCRALRRRRECPGCGRRFTTYEIGAEDLTQVFADRERLRQWLVALDRMSSCSDGKS